MENSQLYVQPLLKISALHGKKIKNLYAPIIFKLYKNQRLTHKLNSTPYNKGTGQYRLYHRLIASYHVATSQVSQVMGL